MVDARATGSSGTPRHVGRAATDGPSEVEAPMSDDRRFRGDFDRPARLPDWSDLAREFGVPVEIARELHQEAIRLAGSGEQGHRPVEDIFVERLGDARQAANRPSPGKVTRTMRLAGRDRQRRRLASGPPAPGKGSLASYLSRADPAVPRRPDRSSADDEVARLLPVRPDEAGADAAMRLFEACLAIGTERKGLEAEMDLRPARDPHRPSGRPLPADLQRDLEDAAGLAFDDVRIREDGAATAALDARAFAVGNEVVFGSGEFDPGSSEGRALIAHEVMHTVQQRGRTGRGRPTVTSPRDAVETQADAFAAAFEAGDRAAARSLAASPVRSAPDAVARDKKDKPRVEQPVLFLRSYGEPENRARYARVGLSAQVRDVAEVIRAVLVAYGIPTERAAEFDTLQVEVAPADSPGITRAHLRSSGGVVVVGVSPKLDDYLRDVAARSRPETKGPSGGHEPPATPPGPQEAAPPPPEGGKKRPAGAAEHGGLPIPPRLRGLFTDPPAALTPGDQATWKTITAELLAMSDEDLTMFRLVATSLTDSLA
ncbi:MAG TPA: DUF4157 domain-containing protein, partial [Kofleriaceae bacterium]|nr:DUF4157 domain-containing protein [Kofleriaceae bacterium]